MNIKQIDQLFDDKFMCQGGVRGCKAPHEPMLNDKASYKSIKLFIHKVVKELLKEQV